MHFVNVSKQIAGNTTALPLAAYILGVCGVLSSFGGTAATRPALTSDLFGTKNVGVLTAQQLSVVMPAAFCGPKIASYFRESVMCVYSIILVVLSDKSLVSP